MSFIIKIFGQIMTVFFDIFEDHFFENFGVRRSRFLEFSQLLLELFSMCLRIVFELKIKNFGFILNYKGW